MYYFFGHVSLRKYNLKYLNLLKSVELSIRFVKEYNRCDVYWHFRELSSSIIGLISLAKFSKKSGKQK